MVMSDGDAAVLGVAVDADVRAVRDAYLKKVRRVHPDRGGDVDAFLRLHAAYERMSRAGATRRDAWRAHRVATVLLKAHLRRCDSIQWTGRKRDANKLLRILTIYKAFVVTHAAFMREAYGYEVRRGAPGNKAGIFALFRDVWLPRALREMRAENEKVDVDAVEPTAYLVKRNQALRETKEPCIQTVVGWEPKGDA